MCIKLLNKHEKTEKEISNIKRKSQLRSKFEKSDNRGSVWRFFKYMLVTVIKFEGKVAKRASYIKLPRENQAKLLIESKGIMWNLKYSSLFKTTNR